MSAMLGHTIRKLTVCGRFDRGRLSRQGRLDRLAVGRHHSPTVERNRTLYGTEPESRPITLRLTSDHPQAVLTQI